MRSTRSDEELETIFLRRIPPDGWDDWDWKNERERALGELWQRRFASSTARLSSEEVDTLLDHSELETALASLGDAARLNLLSEEHGESILRRDDIDQCPKAAWAKQEISLRLRVNKFVAEIDPKQRRSILDALLRQKKYWPIEALIGELSPEELLLCEAALDNPSVLSRNGREQARQAIRARRKANRIRSQ